MSFICPYKTEIVLDTEEEKGKLSRSRQREEEVVAAAIAAIMFRFM
jgi:hypothetical protein